MKREIFLLFLLALSSASLNWQFNTDGAISVKPLIYQGAVVVASDDGKIYGIDPASGAKKWQAIVGKEPNELTIFENTLVVSTTKGKLVRIGTNGVVQWTVNLNTSDFNASYVYGASANTKFIFVTADNGVFVFEKNGSLRSKITTYNRTTVTAPAAGTDFVIFGKGRELIRLSETGQTQWKSALSEGSYWLSRPVLDGNVVYVGGLDDRMHAFAATNGLELWNVRTRNWVAGSALSRSGMVYFGSNDGNVYAVDSGSGFVKWTAHTQLAVQSQPETGIMGGTETVFVGSTDKSVYAIDGGTGSIVWKGPAAGIAGSPLFYSNSIIFGAGDGKVYSYSTERACSIVTPHEAEIVSQKELVISGSYVSESGSARVMVSINDGPPEESNTTESGWIFNIDPKQKLSPGLNTISCRVVDAAGEESGPTFTTVAINHDPSIPVSQFVVTLSPNIIEGKPLTIFVNDGDDGAPVDRFELVFNGLTYKGNKNITLPSAPAAGSYPATIKKIGFNDYNFTVNVNASGISPVVLGVSILLIVIIIWQMWSRFLSKKFAKKKR
jgi:outer membrane protein assembly factor BamB